MMTSNSKTAAMATSGMTYLVGERPRLRDSMMPWQRRYHHYLKGLLACQRCDRRLIVMRGKSKTGELYFYYVCRGRQDGDCDLPYVRVAQIEQAVANHYRTVQLPGDLRNKLTAGLDQAIDARSNQDADHKARLGKRLAELDRQEDRYIELPPTPIGRRPS